MINLSYLALPEHFPITGKTQATASIFELATSIYSAGQLASIAQIARIAHRTSS
jgi:hypothetical protein